MVLIKTERIQLHEVTLNDHEFIFELLNNPTWIQNIGNRGINTRSDAEAYINNSLIDSYKINGFGLYKMIISNEDKPIGLCGLLKRKELEHVDIGFAILPEYAGNGLTFEAAMATLSYAFNELGLKTILGITSKQNIASQNLLKKIGLRFQMFIEFGNNSEETMLFTSD